MPTTYAMAEEAANTLQVEVLTFNSSISDWGNSRGTGGVVTGRVAITVSKVGSRVNMFRNIVNMC